MDIIKPAEFIKYFPDHVFRFIDQTGEGRKPVIDRRYQRDLNHLGYEAYFTVNGFANFEKDGDNRREHLTCLNGFFVDIDGRKNLDEIKLIKEKLNPTFIVETMRGFHFYWLLDETIYKEENVEEWDRILKRWEGIELAIVTGLNGDPVVKDATRILRVPGSYYWKKTKNAYLGGVEMAPFKIKILYSNLANRYSMEQIAEVFPLKESATAAGSNILNHEVDSSQSKSKSEKEDFFARVDEKFPIEKRDSFIKMISGKPDSIPPGGSRNQTLLITACMARRAGWSEKKVFDEVIKSGWHGMVAEHAGETEIKNTVASAFRGGYIFGTNNPIIEWNTTDGERTRMRDTYTIVMKEKRETDKVRFSTYEKEIYGRFPFLKKNEAGVLFNYHNGVYKMLTGQEETKIILDALYEDMLWGYRTNRCVSDKLSCLIALLPVIKETEDTNIINMKNGLLNIKSKKLDPHTPEYVSYVQFPIDYDPEAKCPTWEKVIQSWTVGDEAEEKAMVLQEYAGYCVTSDMRYAKALFLIGDGGNGKSTYADTIAMLVGDQATGRLSLESIYTQFGMAGLIGKRLNIVEEISANFFHGHKIQALISGEEQTIEMKYKPQFKFKPGLKFIFAVNQMPRVDDASSGMERRILAVNFKNNFRINPNIDLRFSNGLLAQELPGIFNWSLEGLYNLIRNHNFTATKERAEIIQEYREENSSVAGFVGDCTRERQGTVMYVADLYEVYREYCLKDGRVAKSRISFSKELKMHAMKTEKFTFITRVTHHTEAKVEGLELKEEWDRNTIRTFVIPRSVEKEDF